MLFANEAVFNMMALGQQNAFANLGINLDLNVPSWSPIFNDGVLNPVGSSFDRAPQINYSSVTSIFYDMAPQDNTGIYNFDVSDNMNIFISQVDNIPDNAYTAYTSPVNNERTVNTQDLVQRMKRHPGIIDNTVKYLKAHPDKLAELSEQIPGLSNDPAQLEEMAKRVKEDPDVLAQFADMLNELPIEKIEEDWSR